MVHTPQLCRGGEGGDVRDAAVEVNSSFSVAAFAINSSLSLLCVVSVYALLIAPEDSLIELS